MWFSLWSKEENELSALPPQLRRTQQSQDDGWDQVVWRVSPTTERLQGVSTTDNAHQSRLDVLVLQCNKNTTNLPNVDTILTRVSSASTETSVTCPHKKVRA